MTTNHLTAALTARRFVASTSYPGAYDHADMRAVVTPEDGVELIGWSPDYPGARVISWEARFQGGTPDAVIIAAVDAALAVAEATSCHVHAGCGLDCTR